MLSQAYLTIGLVAETSVTLCWQRRAFWLSLGNWFDAAVCVTSILSFMLYWYGGRTGLLDEALLFVMVGWLALRIARLVMTLKKVLRERSRRSMAAHLDIAFPENDDDDDDDDGSDVESPRASDHLRPVRVDRGAAAAGPTRLGGGDTADAPLLNASISPGNGGQAVRP